MLAVGLGGGGGGQKGRIIVCVGIGSGWGLEVNFNSLSEQNKPPKTMKTKEVQVGISNCSLLKCFYFNAKLCHACYLN